MNKKTEKLKVVTEFKNGNEVVELLPIDDAKERFVFLVRCAMEIGFERVRSIRLVSGKHVSFEWRDIRSIVEQSKLLDYECSK